MNEHKTVAAIHDLSGYGRCALTVILPVISAMGIQACAVPTAVLSTHTGGFEDFVIQDLTEHISDCCNHYRKLGLRFDAIYSGFLSSPRQVDCCLEFFDSFDTALKVVDPVLGDNGKAYSTCTSELQKRMRELVKIADVITPNLTEACMLLGEEYPEYMTAQQAKDWLERLCGNAKYVVVKGVPLKSADGAVMSNVGYERESGSFWRIDWEYIPQHYPGTGDIFTSVLTGALLKGDNLPVALNRATAFTQLAVKTTYNYVTDTRNGVYFEDVIGWLGTNPFLSDYRSL